MPKHRRKTVAERLVEQASKPVEYHANGVAKTPVTWTQLKRECEEQHEELLEAERLKEALKESARRHAPDYPNIETEENPFEHLWALTSLLEGITTANDDWHRLIKELQKIYDIPDEFVIGLSKKLWEQEDVARRMEDSSI